MKGPVLVYALIFSLVLNVAIIGSAVVMRSLASAPTTVTDQAEAKPLERFITEDLKPEPAVAKQLVDAVTGKREAIRKLRDNIFSVRSELMEMITAENADSSAIENQLAQMERLHHDLRRAAIGTLSQISKSLGPEDRKKFRTYLKERTCGCGPMTGVKGPFGEPTGGR